MLPVLLLRGQLLLLESPLKSHISKILQKPKYNYLDCISPWLASRNTCISGSKVSPGGRTSQKDHRMSSGQTFGNPSQVGKTQTAWSKVVLVEDFETGERSLALNYFLVDTGRNPSGTGFLC